MMQIADIPLEIYNRALDLYGVERETTVKSALAALMSAQERKDVTPDFPGITPFAQALAEYISLSGPFAEDGGEFAGCNGYCLK